MKYYTSLRISHSTPRNKIQIIKMLGETLFSEFTIFSLWNDILQHINGAVWLLVHTSSGKEERKIAVEIKSKPKKGCFAIRN